ncbi:DNA breaking-rejoining protein [Citrobacter koseri]|uniref:DNA breaking-rejoining protein n=1 Tax=Citrobacter koseri TaxID=545 RepID=UPI0016518D37|nr:DNA breaking-rejoining protein [Citrobacter koseri]
MKNSPLIWRGFLHPEFNNRRSFMEIVKIEMNLKAVNKELAVFNCEKKVSGVIHSAETGAVTVILDGGYVFGKFDCPLCAVEAISMLSVKVSDGDNAGFGNYRSYKLDYSEKVFSTIH